jgi:8-oxo-dGTP diphosphatase
MSLPMKRGPSAIADQLTTRPGHVNRRTAATITDRLWQLAYAIAYRLLRIWWFLRRPAHHGALVALWHDGEILVLRSSYRGGWSLPGGGIARGESPREAATRELREEIGLAVAPDALHEAQALALVWERRSDHTTIFELALAQRPTLRLDNREIVGAAFRPPDTIAPDEVAPHVALYLRRFRAK